MAGSGAARVVEHEAEGIIAKAAKDVLRDAERASTGDASRAGGRAVAGDTEREIAHRELGDASAALEHDAAASGGRVRPADIGEWDTWANDEYARIRSDSGDVDAIADGLSGSTLPDGTTVTRDDVDAIKTHLFDREHTIVYQDGTQRVARFDADPEIAEAWTRLGIGEATANDRLLLQHELAESRYLDSHPEATYDEAHAAANRHADWQQAVEGDG